MESVFLCKHTNDVSDLVCSILSTERGHSKDWRNVQPCVANSSLTLGRYSLELEAHVRRLENKVDVLTSTVEALLQDAKLKENRYQLDALLQNEALKYWKENKFPDKEICHRNEARKLDSTSSRDPSKIIREEKKDLTATCDAERAKLSSAELSCVLSNSLCNLEDEVHFEARSSFLHRKGEEVTSSTSETNAMKADIKNLRQKWKAFLEGEEEELGEGVCHENIQDTTCLHRSPVFSHLKRPSGACTLDMFNSGWDKGTTIDREEVPIMCHSRWVWRGCCSTYGSCRPLAFDSVLKLGVERRSVCNEFLRKNHNINHSSENCNKYNGIEAHLQDRMDFFSWPSKETIIVKVSGLYKVTAGVAVDEQSIFSTYSKEMKKKGNFFLSFHDELSPPPTCISIYVNGATVSWSPTYSLRSIVKPKEKESIHLTSLSNHFYGLSTHDTRRDKPKKSSLELRKTFLFPSRSHHQGNPLRVSSPDDCESYHRSSLCSQVLEGYLFISRNSVVDLQFDSTSNTQALSRCFFELEFLA